MVSIKLRPAVVMFAMALVIFNSIERGSTGEGDQADANAEAQGSATEGSEKKDSTVKAKVSLGTDLEGEEKVDFKCKNGCKNAKPIVVKDTQALGVQEACVEKKPLTKEETTTIEMEIREKCKGTLREATFNGVLIHDALEVSTVLLTDDELRLKKKIKEFNETFEENSDVTIGNYKTFVGYLFIKIPTTDIDLVQFFCDTIGPLMRLGYTGDFVADKTKDERIIGVLEDDKKKYLSYLTSDETQDKFEQITKTAVTPINMFYQYCIKNKWIHNTVEAESDKCRNEQIAEGYNGTMKNFTDMTGSFNLTVGKPPPYELFVMSLLDNGVKSTTDKNFVIVYCDIAIQLQKAGYTGIRAEDMDRAKTALSGFLGANGEVSNRKLDLIYGYNYFLNSSKSKDCEKDLINKYAAYRMSTE